MKSKTVFSNFLICNYSLYSLVSLKNFSRVYSVWFFPEFKKKWKFLSWSILIKLELFPGKNVTRCKLLNWNVIESCVYENRLVKKSPCVFFFVQKHHDSKTLAKTISRKIERRWKICSGWLWYCFLYPFISQWQLVESRYFPQSNTLSLNFLFLIYLFSSYLI